MKKQKKLDKKIKFVYFDVGGVMLRWRPLLEKISKQHNKSLKHVEKAFYKYDDESCRGKLTPQQMWEKLRQELQIHTPDDINMLQYSLDAFSPIVETHAFATELIKQVKIGLLTNVYPSVFEQSLKRGHVPNLSYSVVVQSCEIGLIKPEKEIFLYAQKKAGVKGENILFIDDFEVNTKAASDFGWNVQLYNTDNPQESIKHIRDNFDL